MAKLAVLVLHGIGNHTPAFADDMIEELTGRLGRAAEDVVFQPCLWGNVLDERENELSDKIAAQVDKNRLRRELVIGGFGDLVSYMGPPTGPSLHYRQIHERMESSLSQLEAKLRKMGCAPEATPLVIMAHSLGGYLMSNYLWDHQTQNPHAFARSPFTSCDTLAQIITFGCNLPLTGLALPSHDTHPVKPFGALVKNCFSDQGGEMYGGSVKWLNLFDPDDILGFPLAPVNDAYARQVRDLDINTGGLLFAHVRYWTDRDFTKPVSARLRELLTYMVA